MTAPENPDVPPDRAATRANPLPEEEGTAPGAEEILTESEERIAGAVHGDEPADDAEQRRRSEETL
ncbi:hypothetical protein Ae168Ps1_3852 [Pseudonocardia sp. Ae168_Ps1]|jgi:hypothetical protein|uniref:hypothetical protein n=1 Tax=unclassified Pseudonocardia TaxID=2619320 RepID=UPI0001FFEDAB|nr:MULTISPECIES: hypothetical protein [unclassified Pseudonocardia]ALE75155.1 hypothetical protein FRP1_23590 [Pseudonocardia sp. EC080625-04]ALL74518.1 hypothetical protein AD006_02785 [Pseudonocardia sp. EC080610-09]ALL81537.1 hypothetical protein AD017_10600 [Pseudonocardia sp. EC080619-01]OLL75451.1 hypothetical protein Ae150APs1_3829 [Pseudonocardia sp. Ae150A_Ps1]OLL81446.1 hypothetical protein Ae168Ps1_3852 [Pseudonocardia sp. Ae168_Ps1]